MNQALIFPFDSPRVRLTNPITSHEAADSNNIAASARYVVEVLRVFGPLVDHELVRFHESDRNASRYGTFTPQRLRTARHELTEQGLVEDTGYYHMTDSNRRARVWQIVEVAA